MKFFLLLLCSILLIAFSQAQTCPGTGSINFQRWNNINGTAVSNLTSNPNYPNNPSSSGTRTLFEMQSNLGSNFGIKMYGYICAPTTGSYTFWIASDASAELWLSTTTSPANKIRIAFNTSSTNSRQWTKFTSQKSVAIALTAGNQYYVEALMKEGSGGDNLAVGWAKPGQSTTAPSEVIPGTSLLTQLFVPDFEAPTIPTNINSAAPTQTSFTLRWTASTDNVAVTGYDVYRDGLKINGSLVPATSYIVTGLTAGATNSYYVIAKDAAGNSSVSSSTLVVTTLTGGSAIESFTMRTVIANQRMPHDLVYGPDGNIWFTERFAGKVSFVNPATGVKTTVLTLGGAMVRTGGQDGLMGLALHPQFNSGKPYVYISYTYNSTSATVRKTRIARYTYNSTTQVLEAPETMLENIPGSNDHNSARIAISPSLFLFYSVGDMGAGQFDNLSRPNNAQNLNIYEGKILRLNTELVNSSWIPANNPFTNGGQPTAVYSFGHRNPQGLVFGTINNILYSSEHGPFSDDELNIIENGRNYGWPNVIGWCDGNYNGRTTGGFTIANEQNNCITLNAKEPIRSLFPSTNPPTGGDISTWPSVGHSGMDYYGSTSIPGWENSLLVAQLKKGAVARYKLSNDGLNIISDTIHYFKGLGRFRDVVVSPDGLKIYVACDSSGQTSGPTGGSTTVPANPGSILEFTYTGPLNMFRNTNPIVEAQLPSTNTKNKTIDVYPNPANQFFVVYNYSIEKNRTGVLYDLNGKILKQQPLQQTASRIDVSNLTPGTYILKIVDATKQVIRTEKILVVR